MEIRLTSSAHSEAVDNLYQTAAAFFDSGLCDFVAYIGDVATHVQQWMTDSLRVQIEQEQHSNGGTWADAIQDVLTGKKNPMLHYRGTIEQQIL
ncbi:hypothetical protein ACFS07_36465 [Undibacterium arcticum]